MKPTVMNAIALPLLFQLGGAGRTVYDGVSIPTLPAGHPRLYLRAGDLADLQRRTTNAVLEPVWERLGRLGKEAPQFALEYDALRYLLNHDDQLARRTVAATLKLMDETTFDMHRQDVTRPIGRHMLMSPAMVYDWKVNVFNFNNHQHLDAGAFQHSLQRSAGVPVPFLRSARVPGDAHVRPAVCRLSCCLPRAIMKARSLWEARTMFTFPTSC